MSAWAGRFAYSGLNWSAKEMVAPLWASRAVSPLENPAAQVADGIQQNALRFSPNDVQYVPDLGD